MAPCNDSSTSDVVDTVVNDNVEAFVGGLVGRDLGKREHLGHGDGGCNVSLVMR